MTLVSKPLYSKLKNVWSHHMFYEYRDAKQKTAAIFMATVLNLGSMFYYSSISILLVLTNSPAFIWYR